jgi:2-polyprenyl-3-methyl-5-hydroxy-6-metoxy-1,4-benzoquinol methylase
MADTNSVLISEELIAEVHAKMIRSIDLAQVIHILGMSEEELRPSYAAAVEESRQTLSLLTDLQLFKGSKVLEVGAGFGLASICLAMMGFDVVALEPGGLGFEQNRSASMAFASSCDVQINHVAASAEDVDFRTVGKFDLVVSNNVLEHIPNFGKALTNLNSAINPGGVMIHSCPNYAFPFEPHFGIPLIPVMPRLTRLLLPKSVKDSGLWNSLNFITQSQVKRNARVNGMTCLFRTETMSKSIKRLNRDPQFAERHQTIARLVKLRFVYALLVRIFSLPPRFATPMDFIVCAPEQSESSNVRIWMKSR